ncbi:MAG TPA: hypothetical protein VKA81_09605 [Verrucomicrobiae bacterium]|nr:hypothetical protein [Verrucomicrobiae bacterium]
MKYDWGEMPEIGGESPGRAGTSLPPAAALDAPQQIAKGASLFYHPRNVNQANFYGPLH